jgi:hypothetical protein
MVMGLIPGPAPRDQARVSSISDTRSSWRTRPNEKRRRNVPNVEGAITR